MGRQAITRAPWNASPAPRLPPLHPRLCAPQRRARQRPPHRHSLCLVRIGSHQQHLQLMGLELLDRSVRRPVREFPLRQTFLTTFILHPFLLNTNVFVTHARLALAAAARSTSRSQRLQCLVGFWPESSYRYAWAL